MSVSAEAAVEARTDRLVGLLDERELDCLLVTNLVNVRYLTGFTGTNGACVVSGDERLFLTDFRYVEQASSQVEATSVWRRAGTWWPTSPERLRGRAGFDDAHMTVAVHRKLGEKVAEGVELVPAGGLVEGLREVKDELELDAIRAAAADRRRGLRGAASSAAWPGGPSARWRVALDALARGPRSRGPVVSGDRGRRARTARCRTRCRATWRFPRGTLVVIDMGRAG